jgi:hypothetical protein
VPVNGVTPLCGRGPKLGVSLACADPGALAGFWAAALGWESAPGADGVVVLAPPGRRGPRLVLRRQAADGGPGAGEPAITLDLEAVDVTATTARLEGLGAVTVSYGVGTDGRTTWSVLADPEGNEFCVSNSVL